MLSESVPTTNGLAEYTTTDVVIVTSESSVEDGRCHRRHEPERIDPRNRETTECVRICGTQGQRGVDPVLASGLRDIGAIVEGNI